VPKNTKTVLIVEDNVDLAEMFAQWLADTYAVQVAHTGAEAVEQFDEAVDVILLDRKLPNFDAAELTDELRRSVVRNDYETDCLIALITSLSPDENVLDVPHDAYFEKPVREEELVELLEYLLYEDDVGMVALKNGVVLKRDEGGLSADDEEPT